jgi:hypothetical protein
VFIWVDKRLFRLNRDLDQKRVTVLHELPLEFSSPIKFWRDVFYAMHRRGLNSIENANKSLPLFFETLQ